MQKQFFNPEPSIIAHRGLSIQYPENTLLSFSKAIELGVDVIETDIHLTKDNRFVIIHDDVIDRVSNGKGFVLNHTLEELKQFDAGYWFSPDENKSFPYRGTGLKFFSLEEMLEYFPDQRFNIDLKDKNPAQVKQYSEIINKYNPKRILTASEHGPNLKEFRKIMPDMATSFSLWEVIGLYFLLRTGFLFAKKKFAADAIQIPEYIGPSHLADLPLIREMHKHDIRVHVWTVNNEQDMKRLLDSGVDGIITDDPALLKRVLIQA
jgi:glycerophosphoryl diester phosphodiesterase